jgi:hypothetical protein
MAALTFDDLVSDAPAAPASKPSRALTFDDLIPKSDAAPSPAPSGGMSLSMPEIDMNGFPTGRMLPSEPMNTMPYGEQMGHIAEAAGKSANRIASNLPFADRGTAALMAATGTGNYADNLAAVRAYNEQQAKENPTGEIAATVAGAALPIGGMVGKAAEGANWLQKAIRTGTLGGLWGGTQAASNVPDYTHITSKDLANIAEGTGIGAALGSGLSVAGGLAGKAYNWAANKFNGRIPGMIEPAQEKLTQAIMADDPMNVVSTLRKLGPEGRLVDAGPNLEGIGLGTYRAGGPQKQFIKSELDTRDLGGNDRMQQSIGSNLGPDVSPQAVHNAIGNEITIRSQSQLPQVFANAPSVNTSKLKKTIEDASVPAVGAEKNFLDTAYDWLTEKIQGGQGTIPVTDAQKLHNTKIALDKLIDYGDDSLGVPKGAVSKTQTAVKNVRYELNQALRNQVPGYGDVMDQLSPLYREQEAIQRGMDETIGKGMHPSDFSNIVNNMQPNEQEGLRAGLLGNIYRATGKQGNDLQALKGMVGKPDDPNAGYNRQYLEKAFGQQPIANVFDQDLGNELAMRGTQQKILYGSKTGESEAMAKALQEGAPPPQPLLPHSWKALSAGGMVAEPIRTAINVVHGAFAKPVDYGLRNLQLGQAVVGPKGRDALELVRQALQAAQNQGANLTQAQRLNYATQLMGAQGANAALNQRRQPLVVPYTVPKP